MLKLLLSLFSKAYASSKDSNLGLQSTESSIKENSEKSVREFSARSLQRLSQCDVRLQELAKAILQEMDITVLCGYRGEAEQNKAFDENRSKLKFPMSKHNMLPSRAVDLAPHPVNWSDIEAFKKMCEIAEDKARKMGIKIRLGRDFSFHDYPHIELIN